jgi:apolipoprotein N-acyltransferase
MGKDVMVMEAPGKSGAIYIGKVITGGLLCGLVINIGESILNLFVIPADMAEVLKARNLPEIGGAPIAGFILFGFLLGIGIVWLYAAIRPRFGAGPKTAIIAGLAVWLLAYTYPGLGMMFMGFFPAGLTVFTLVWGLVEVLLGAVAGARVYTE